MTSAPPDKDFSDVSDQNEEQGCDVGEEVYEESEGEIIDDELLSKLDSIRMAIQSLDTIGVPEKALVLERLEEHGIKVPRMRMYISAASFERDDLTIDLKSFFEDLIKFLFERDEDGIIVRSAHPLEHLFSGGAFESFRLNIDPEETPESLWQKIKTVRSKIVDLADPQNSLIVARDVLFGEIKGYQAEDMGVYINELVGDGSGLYTVVPIVDNKLMLVAGSETGGQGILTFEDKGVNEGAFSRMFFAAQEVFQDPHGHEQEIIWPPGVEGPVWVQSRRVEKLQVGEENQGATLEDTDFEKGVHCYYSRDGKRYLWDLYGFEIQNAFRSGVALVVDEFQWLMEAGILDPFDWEEMNDSELLFSVFDKLLENPLEAVAVLESKYSELVLVARENTSIALFVKSSFFIYNLPEAIEDVLGEKLLKLRSMLESVASILFCGSTAIHHSSKDKGSHARYGLKGPRQIEVNYNGAYLDYYSFLVPEASHSEASKCLAEIKTGDVLTVIVKDRMASLKCE